MRKIICDRCGSEITGDRIGYLAATWKSRSDDSFMQPSPYEDYDFCEACMKDVMSVIDFDIIPAPPEPEPEQEPDQDPEEDEEEAEVVARIAETKAPAVKIEKAAVKKPVDKGKVGALAKAGWTNVQIANEMNITSERVRQILKKLEGKK